MVGRTRMPTCSTAETCGPRDTNEPNTKGSLDVQVANGQTVDVCFVNSEEPHGSGSDDASNVTRGTASRRMTFR